MPKPEVEEKREKQEKKNKEMEARLVRNLKKTHAISVAGQDYRVKQGRVTAVSGRQPWHTRKAR